MNKWFRAGGWGLEEIKPIEVVKETPKQLVVREIMHSWSGEDKIREHRVGKETRHENYFKTYEEAYQFLLDKKQRAVEGAEKELFRKKKQLESFVENYGASKAN